MNAFDTYAINEDKIKPAFDISLFLNKNIQDDMLKYQLLTSPWVPNPAYNFKAEITHGKRPFIHAWLQQYDWVGYSSFLKGPLCKLCVLFESPITRGSVKGAFIKSVCWR